MPIVSLTTDQLEMLRSAIDSHIYWQLSESYYRRNGDIVEPGSEIVEDAREIRAFRALDLVLAESSAD